MARSPVRTTPEALQFGLDLLRDFENEKAPAPVSDERKQANRLKATKVKKDERDLKKVSEIDYGKHEKLASELEREEAIAYWEKAASQKDVPRPPGCAHDHQKEIAIYEKPTEEKILAADRFREEGNKAFREENFGLAAVQYRKALLYFDYTFPETDELRSECDKVKLRVHLNMAACKTKLEDWREVLIQCRLALDVDANNVKAYYRRGVALTAQDQFEAAQDALNHAHKLEPQDTLVRQALAALRKKKSAYVAKTKSVAKAALSSSGSILEGEGDEREDSKEDQDLQRVFKIQAQEIVGDQTGAITADARSEQVGNSSSASLGEHKSSASQATQTKFSPSSKVTDDAEPPSGRTIDAPARLVAPQHINAGEQNAASESASGGGPFLYYRDGPPASPEDALENPPPERICSKGLISRSVSSSSRSSQHYNATLQSEKPDDVFNNILNKKGSSTSPNELASQAEEVSSSSTKENLHLRIRKNATNKMKDIQDVERLVDADDLEMHTQVSGHAEPMSSVSSENMKNRPLLIKQLVDDLHSEKNSDDLETELSSDPEEIPRLQQVKLFLGLTGIFFFLLAISMFALECSKNIERL
ncbi:unnamed protein product [Amoebophrya sp. A25]|nr:unnamed protein product [Amoebophrya sp. A25]|eukprot:GSA25T00027011001.1